MVLGTAVSPATSAPPFPQQGQVPWILLAPLLQSISQRNNSNFEFWKQYLVDSPKKNLNCTALQAFFNRLSKKEYRKYSHREIAPGVELDALPSASAGAGKPSWRNINGIELEMRNSRWCCSLVCRVCMCLFCSKLWHPFLDLDPSIQRLEISLLFNARFLRFVGKRCVLRNQGPAKWGEV